jgi:hypothetical protein
LKKVANQWQNFFVRIFENVVARVIEGVHPGVWQSATPFGQERVIEHEVFSAPTNENRQR